jgi:hypothetical protein
MSVEERTCPCGRRFIPRTRMGRPRRWCYVCRPPDRTNGPAAKRGIDGGPVEPAPRIPAEDFVEPELAQGFGLITVGVDPGLPDNAIIAITKRNGTFEITGVLTFERPTNVPKWQKAYVVMRERLEKRIAKMLGTEPVHQGNRTYWRVQTLHRDIEAFNSIAEDVKLDPLPQIEWMEPPTDVVY